MPPKIPPLVIENARLMFRNFSGSKGKYNKEGDRNFNILLDEDVAKAMIDDGWNVKYLKPREEGESPQPIVKVKVNFSGWRPPRIVMITSRGKTPLDESMIDILDWADFANVDLIVNPSVWDHEGETMVTAYLQSIFVTIREDALEQKYADVPDSAISSMVVEEQKETPF